MSRFLPARASPPPKSTTLPPAIKELLADTSRTSTISVPELAGLTPQEVDFIDAVIERAPATATTFLTVFKAYNDILQERGLDPQNEVVYYGKLLKLGTLKGKNWGEKWRSVKQQQNYNGVSAAAKRRTTRVTRTPVPRNNTQPAARLKTISPDDDTYTLHSHQDEVDTVHDEPTNQFDIREDTPQYHQTPRLVTQRAPSPTFTSTTNTLGLDTGPPSTYYQPLYPPQKAATRPPARYPITRDPLLWDGETTEATVETAHTPSTIPPSYGAATRAIPISRPPTRAQEKFGFIQRESASPPPAAHLQRIAQVRERRGSVINEDDAWTKIKAEQDEKEADRFREDRLVERCWNVWRQGYEWIITTNAQIAEARDHLILRIALQKWRIQTASIRELDVRVSALSNSRRIKHFFQAWRTKWKERKQVAWRANMRARMKAVRDMRDAKVRKDMWAKWRQAYRAHIAAQRYTERLVLRMFGRWKGKSREVDQLESAADHILVALRERQLERQWDVWKRSMEMRRAERLMVERVELRIAGNALETWKQRLHEYRMADEFYDVVVVKQALRSWKAARDRIHARETRATKHLARQNEVLVIAFMRIWKARERGRLLDRVRTVRTLKLAWNAWQARIQQQRGLEDLALAFQTRASSTVVSSSLQRWRAVYSAKSQTQAFADRYRHTELQFRMLRTWRLQLRVKMHMTKQAKIQAKYFVLRGAWRIWREKLAEQNRNNKLKVFEARVAQTYFLEWLQRARTQRRLKIAEQIIQQQIAMRIMSDYLVRWTNRVANLKFRELETTQNLQRRVLAEKFNKWKALCIRHVEELSLMESYQDVKREENMRKMFYRWLAAARVARHRRLLLLQREEDLKRMAVSAVWDKWRERFLDIRLQPLADDFVLQMQNNLVFRMFGIWHSKTRSLPAVRFHASQTKAKFWAVWRDAMPRALQAKAARERDKKSILAKSFGKWIRHYKTKIQHKAIARARYIRLPTAAPRQIAQNPRPAPLPQAPIRTVFSRRTLQSSIADADRPSTSSPLTQPVSTRSGLASLLSTRSRSPNRAESSASRPKLSTRSPSRPKLSSRATTVRDPSPVASTYDGVSERGLRPALNPAPPSEVGRSTLWQELRGMQLRARPSSHSGRERSQPP